MSGKSQLVNARSISLVLVLAVVVAFLPVIGLDFTNYDDPDYVTENRPVLAGLTSNSLRWAFTHSHSANWHPLTWMSHMLDCQLYGLNPAGHHFTNVLFHAANCLLLFLLLRSITGAIWPSACVAAVFALHPLRVESVAWVSERKDVLCAFFGLLSLWAYAKYVKSTATQSLKSDSGPKLEAQNAHKVLSTQWYYALALIAFALGLLSKPMIVTWPFVMLILDYWPLRRFDAPRLRPQLPILKRLFLEKIPFFALSAASCAVTVLVQKAAGALASAPVGSRIVNALVCYFHYICKLVWPTRLAVLYPEVPQWPISQVLIAVHVLAAISVLALWQIKRRPWLFAGWAWFLGTLVPVIGLVKVGSQSMADRYTYLTTIGLLIMLVWSLAEAVSNLPKLRTGAALAAGAVLLACAFATESQISFWQNTDTLFRHAIATTRNNYVAYSSLAFYYADHQEMGQAENCLRASLVINPQYYQAWNKLGSVLIDERRYDEAAVACETSLRLDSSFAPAHSTLGLALMKVGRTNEAVAQYSEALRLRPDFAPAHYNLANALAAQGDFEQAREHYSASLLSDPDSAAAADAHNNLGYILARGGSLDAAVSEFLAAIARKPGSWQAQYGLGEILARQGKLDAAATTFSRVLHLRPDHPLAHYQLALTFTRQGKLLDALPHYREAVRLSPNFADALNRLAWILATSPDPQIRKSSEAIALAERACQVTGYKKPAVLETLAAAYAEAGRFDEAVTTAENAKNLLTLANQPELARRNEKLLELFRGGHPYHEAAGAIIP
jgi:tetratricopeptide (TPR) repeat protein